MGCFSNPVQVGKTNQTGTTSQTGTSQTSQTGSQNQTGQVTNQATQTTTPNLPAWYSSFLASIPAAFQSQASNLQGLARNPYGPQQQAQYGQQLNQLYGQAKQDETSTLASRGALNSGRAAAVDTGLDVGKANAMGQYLSQVPMLNNDAALKAAGLGNQLTSTMAGFTSPINAFGSTTTGNSVQDTINQLLSSLNGNTNTTANGTTSSSGTTSSGQQGGCGQQLLGSFLGAAPALFGL